MENKKISEAEQKQLDDIVEMIKKYISSPDVSLRNAERAVGYIYKETERVLINKENSCGRSYRSIPSSCFIN